jgi:hypothetical protein
VKEGRHLELVSENEETVPQSSSDHWGQLRKLVKAKHYLDLWLSEEKAPSGGLALSRGDEDINPHISAPPLDEAGSRGYQSGASSREGADETPASKQSEGGQGESGSKWKKIRSFIKAKRCVDAWRVTEPEYHRAKSVRTSHPEASQAEDLDSNGRQTKRKFTENEEVVELNLEFIKRFSGGSSQASTTRSSQYSPVATPFRFSFGTAEHARSSASSRSSSVESAYMEAAVALEANPDAAVH